MYQLSWDIGVGTFGHGNSAIFAWEALRVMKELNIQPRRTGKQHRDNSLYMASNGDLLLV